MWSIFELSLDLGWWNVNDLLECGHKDEGKIVVPCTALIEPKEGVPICKLHVTCSGHKYNYLSFGMMIAISFPLSTASPVEKSPLDGREQASLLL